MASRPFAQTRQQSSIRAPQTVAALTVPATGRKRIQPEMAQPQYISNPPLLTATLRIDATAGNQGVTTPRLGLDAQQSAATPGRPIHSFEPSARLQPSDRQQQLYYEQPRGPTTQRRLSSRQQLPSYNMPPAQRQPPTRQEQPSYDMSPAQRQPPTRQQQPSYDIPSSQKQSRPRRQPSSQGLLVNTQQPTEPEQIAALNLKLETYRQIIVDLMKPVVGQKEPAVSAEQLKTSLRKAVSNPQPRNTTTPYPDTPPYIPSPNLNAPSQPQLNSECFELAATSLPQSRLPPPYVDTNPYRNKSSKLAVATSNHHRTASQPHMKRPQWPSTPDPSETSSRTLSPKEVSEPEPPRQPCDSNGVPVPAGCYLLDSRAIGHGLGLMAEYLNHNNADLTIIAVGGLVSAYYLKAWTAATDVDALGTTLTAAQLRLLASAASYAKSRSPVPLGDGWFSGHGMQNVHPEVARDVYELSMQQNDIVFRSEGLTVLAPRWSYAFMVCVDRLSRGVGVPYDMGNAVLYLRQYVKTGKHKLIPILGIMKWGEGYDLRVSLGVLRMVKKQYLGHYGKEAISE
ncbi:hypothetical protein VE03_03679 [Pseudogymnoascus sp. 23342-1-I1]|nr:hypothetical protein VE03_03574 [Pseudogymnoascus sp. 23342-1-I1]OBT66580.1 hypothetical protein VE03_03679 [Pseudogymnoascus sp. 23342-1-I1]